MGRLILSAILALAFAMPATTPAKAEILAMFNYESKPDESLKALKQTAGVAVRREGIAIVDVDPKSANYKKILVDVPLPNDGVAHHIFYNKDASKAYVTALGKPRIYTFELNKFPYRVKTVSVPQCSVGEDIVFSDDNKRWYLSCMGSNNVIVGDAATDKVIQEIKTPKYPHGIAVHDGIDRILITSTVNATTLKDAGETITAIQASTGKVLESIKVSNKPSPAGEAPVEIVFLPGTNPPVAYVTNMFGGSLWAATWNPGKKTFDTQQVFDFNPHKVGVPLEVYFNKKMDRLYVTTANPGNFHIFDISGGPLKPKLLKTIATAGGAHHVAITRDEKLAFVQNSFINLPGMSDGSVTVVDLEKQKAIDTIDTFKSSGLNPNLIVLLPEWYNAMGHCNNGPASCF